MEQIHLDDHTPLKKNRAYIQGRSANIAVLYNAETEQYALSPLFDQGLCLFADTSND